MGPFLAEAQSVSEATSIKREFLTVTAYIKARTLQDIPTQRPPHDQLELPTAYESATVSFDGDDLGSPGGITPDDRHMVQLRSNVAAGIAVKRPRQAGSRDRLCPAPMRHRG